MASKIIKARRVELADDSAQEIYLQEDNNGNLVQVVSKPQPKVVYVDDDESDNQVQLVTKTQPKVVYVDEEQEEPEVQIIKKPQPTKVIYVDEEEQEEPEVQIIKKPQPTKVIYVDEEEQEEPEVKVIKKRKPTKVVYEEVEEEPEVKVIKKPAKTKVIYEDNNDEVCPTSQKNIKKDKDIKEKETNKKDEDKSSEHGRLKEASNKSSRNDEKWIEEKNKEATETTKLVHTGKNKVKVFSIISWIIIGIFVALTITSAVLYFLKVKSISIDYSKTGEAMKQELENAYKLVRPYLIMFMSSMSGTIFVSILFFGIQTVFSVNNFVPYNSEKETK